MTMCERAPEADSICRACSGHFRGGEFDLLKMPGLLEIFIRVSNTTVDDYDVLPKTICSSCKHRLDDFIEFQAMCIKSYQHLLSLRLYDQLKTETQELTIAAFSETEPPPAATTFVYNTEIENIELNCKKAGDDEDDRKLANEVDPFDDSYVKIESPNLSHANDFAASSPDSESDDEILAEKIRKSKQTPKRDTETKKPADERVDENNQNGSGLKGRKEKPYVCTKCPKTFLRKEVYWGHMRQHEGLKPFECETCGKKYSRIERLKNHILSDHSDNPMRFCCDIEGCDKKYRNRETLKRHINSHFNPPPPVDKSTRQVFICELCGKQLSTKGVLKEHEMMHKGEFPYACDLCPRRFRVKNKLYLHKLRHEGVKNFTCKICGLKKTTNKELKSHMNVHTREKQYPCKFCDIIFLTNGNLVRHVQVVHDGIKSYVCTYCDRAFGKAETLRNHTMKHTGERPLPCPHCERRFISRTSLQYHVKKHEKETDTKNSHPEPVREEVPKVLDQSDLK